MPVEAKLVLPLLSRALEIARETIGEGRRLLPFCLTLNREGQISSAQALEVEGPGDEIPLQKGLVACIATDQILALAIGAEMRRKERNGIASGKVVRILIEAPGYARHFDLPYERSKPSPRTSSAQQQPVFGVLLSEEIRPRYFIRH